MLLKAYLFVGTVVLVAFGLIYTTSLIHRLNQQSQAVSGLFARFCAVATFTAIDNPEVRQIFEEVVKPADFPMVLTDKDGRPFVWKLPIRMDSVDVATVLNMDPKHPPSGQLRQLMQIVDRFDRHTEPIPIRRPGSNEIFGWVHYGEASLVRELRWIPAVQIAAIFLFIGLGYIGYRSIKTSEQRSIWIGLAKETAHQLGTPISSLLGWVELLREKQLESEGTDGKIVLEQGYLREVLDEMENDAERLQKVAMRFGQVGSLPRLEVQDVAPIVSEAVRYFRRRIPHLGKDVEIRERYELVPPVSVNKELFEWVVENVLKNAVDATDRKRGTIEVDVVRRRETETVEVRVTDQGRGMTPAEMKMVFSPGFTTKQRGWGLGLTLAKRIVEEYHGGRIWIERSQPGEGSTVVISFPV
jgi:two-component system, NtrC family, sensor histidine kinase KinB